MAYHRHALGIIPARAGSSQQQSRASARCGDHPRACGEQYVVVKEGDVYTGSSPRVRGAVRASNSHGLFPGIIPARAGSRRNT